MTSLTGKQVILRKPRLSDADDIYAIVRDKAIVRYMLLPHPYKREHAVGFIKRTMRVWRRKLPDEYHFSIVERDSECLMGMISVFKIDRTHKNAETGYWLGKEFRGKGYMPEAISLLTTFCFRELKLMRVYAVTFPHNESSQRVLTKCGFTYEGLLRKSHFRRGRHYDSCLFSLLRTDKRRLITY